MRILTIGLPVDAALILLRAALLTLHVGCNALAGGAPLLAAVAPGGSGARKRLAWVGLVAMHVGLGSGLLGVLLIIGAGDEGYARAAARLPGSAYGMLAAEWVFTSVLYAAYLAWWDRLSHRRTLHGLIAVVAATNLLYHFPTMMILLGGLSEEAGKSAVEVIERPEFRRLMLLPDAMWRCAHFWGLSLFAAGVAAGASGALATPARVCSLLGLAALFASGCGMIWTGGIRSGVLSFVSPAGWLFLAGVGCWALVTTRLLGEVVGATAGPRRTIRLSILAVGFMTAASMLAE